MFEAAEVVIGVIAYLMTFFHNLLEEFRVLLHVLAHHEECGLHVIAT